jgi:hypothetical protein
MIEASAGRMRYGNMNHVSSRFTRELIVLGISGVWVMWYWEHSKFPYRFYDSHYILFEKSAGITTD